MTTDTSDSHPQPAATTPVPSEEIRAAYKAVFDTPSGQVVLGHLLVGCAFHEACTFPGDPQMTAFRDGAKHSVRSILFSLSELGDPMFAHRCMENFHLRFGPPQQQ